MSDAWWAGMAWSLIAMAAVTAAVGWPGVLLGLGFAILVTVAELIVHGPPRPPRT